MKLFLKLFLFGFFLSLTGYSQQQPLNVTTSTTASCSDDGTLTINISDGTPPYSISLYSRVTEWQTINTISHTAVTTLPGLLNGRYFLYILDNNNRSFFTQTDVASTLTVDLTTIKTTCNNNGSILASVSNGEAPYSYTWSNGETTAKIENLMHQNYYVKVKDNNGCIYHSDSIYVESDYQFNVNINSTPYSCTTPGTSTANVTGNGAPFTYYWKTLPVQTTQTATNLKAGMYEVVVTNANGCSITSQAYIWQDNVFDIQTTVINEDCKLANGSISVTSSGGTAPYSYLWNNGATTSSISGLSAQEIYTVVATDQVGCNSTKRIYMDRTSPLQLTFSNIEAQCGATGGAATVIVNNGQAPYSYEWNNQATTSTINNIASNTYYVNVIDANGCEAFNYVYVPELASCKSHISGNIYNDMNKNCIKDPSEGPRKHTQIRHSENQYAYTNVNGDFNISVLPGNNTIEVIPPSNWIIACNTNSLSVDATSGGTTYPNNDFAIQPDVISSNVVIDLFANNQRPGFTRPVYLYYQNIGTQLESGSISYTFSNNWDYESADPAADSYNPTTKTATWNYSNLNPFVYTPITIYMKVDLSVGIGVELTATAVITTINNDIELNNNSSVATTHTVNSFDPNDIQVSPQGTSAEGFISSEEETLTYRIRFQNTGTDVAYNVLVKSPLDVNFEDYSLTIIGSSHDFTASIKDDSVFFNFADINLPDSTSNEAQSHGYILYRINRKSDLTPLTQIFNKADIYFDYNAPVETNKVKNTIASITPNVSELQGQDDLLIYPNPCRDHAQLSINIKAASEISVQLYSASGQQIPVLDNISVGQGVQVIDLNLAPFNLTAGLYVAKIVANDKVYTKSILINK